MNDFTISRATRGDAFALSKLGYGTFLETFGNLYAEEDVNAFLSKNHSVDYYSDALSDPRRAMWIAADREGPVGYTCVGPCTLPMPDLPELSGELGRLYLLQRGQGAGVGKLLLDRALNFLEEHFEHIFLSVYAENRKAQEIYARRGFVKVHDYEFMVGNHADPEWIMQLQPMQTRKNRNGEDGASR